MNKKQKNALLLTAAVIFLMFLFPPFHIGYEGGSINKGYSFIFSPSDERATVNIGMLLMQWLGVLILGGIAFFFLTSQKPKRFESSQSHSYPEGSMPREGDMFKGKVNDLRHPPVKGWKYRDIWFFKHEITRKEKYKYPIRGNRIVLIGTEGDRYEMQFTKPDDDEHKVCLGQPTKLKPWYLKKGFDAMSIEPDTWVYFRYTGQKNEFILLTEYEYQSKYRK